MTAEEEEEEKEKETGPNELGRAAPQVGDMACVKTFDLLLGVVLVVRCAELYAAETAARSHGKEPLTHAMTHTHAATCRSRTCSDELGRERVPKMPGNARARLCTT